MKKQFLFVACAFVLMFSLSSCSSTKVITDKDPTVNFDKIRTYQFVGWSENSDKVLNRFDKERIEQAFLTAGLKRGMMITETNPQALVALYVMGEVRTQQTANTTGMGGMGGMGMGMGGMRNPGMGGWGMSTSHTVINETRYIEGTLMIEMFDPIDKKLIWQALAKKTVSEDPKKRAKEIPKTVEMIMSRYPVKKLK